MINYFSGLHPAFGRDVEVINDIIITPYWTEDFCKQLQEVSEFYHNRFEQDDYTADLHWWKFNGFMFVDYAYHYKRAVIPLLNRVYDGIHFSGITSPYIVRHKYGQSTKLHHDISKVTLSVKLNNDYTGGEIVFPRQNFSNKDIPVGYAAFWPGDVTHPHRVTPVESGTKFTVVGFTLPTISDNTPNNTIMFNEI